MGRLVGIRHFLTQAALNEERADITELRRAKASLGEDYDPLEILEDSEDPIGEAQTAIARRLQEQFEGRVLRRTIDSLNWKGRPLLNLPKLHDHTVLLTLQPFEREIHAQIGQKLREE